MNYPKATIDAARADERQIEEFLTFIRLFRSEQRNIRNWTWQFRDYDATKSVLAICRDEGKIIASQTFMPYRINIGCTTYLCAKSESTFLLADYRGQGVMKDLYEYAVESGRSKGYQFVWGFTEAANAFVNYGFSVFPLPSLYLRAGLNILPTITSLLSSSKPLWHRLLAAGKSLKDWIAGIRSLKLPAAPDDRGYSIRQGALEVGDIQHLIEHAWTREKNIISVDMDERYLQWRVREHPFLKYDEYGVYYRDRLVAYAVSTNHAGRVSISDLHSTNGKATTLLLLRILRDNYFMTGRFAIYLNPQFVLGQETLAILREIAFSRHSQTNLVVRCLNPDLEKMLHDTSRWNITGLWTEGYTM